MRTIFDFFTFTTLISPTLLVVVYFVGAIFIPFIGWNISVKIKNKPNTNNLISNTNTLQSKFIAILIIVFLFLEMLWRIMFEFLIAYFQMHDALLELVIK
jgi:hypothetical protein